MTIDLDAYPLPSSPVQGVQAVRDWLRATAGSGIMPTWGDAFEVTTASGLTVTVGSGRAILDGIFGGLEAPEPLTLAGADPVEDRVDRIVLRLDPTAADGGGTVTVDVLEGTPGAAEPAALTQNLTGVFEIALARATVPANSASVSTVTDERTYSSSSPADLDALRNELLAIDAAHEVRLWQIEADLLGATEGTAGWQGDAFLTGQDEVASIAGDVTVSRASTLRGGSLKLSNMPAIGEAYMGGFFAGIIDTTQDNIIAGDAYQVGERYALIVSPQSLEGGSDTGTGDLRWHATGSQSPAGAKTRWDGLAATDALRSLSADYEAAAYAWNLSFPSDGGSRWYLPALDELELIYRMLKPTTTDNYTTDRTGHDFPDDPLVQGVNPSSDPTGDAYTTGDPAQTLIAAFQDGAAEALDTGYYWTSSWATSSGAWRQLGDSGSQSGNTQTYTSGRVRPVRRVAL